MGTYMRYCFSDLSNIARYRAVQHTRTRSRSLTSSNKRAEGRTYCSESSTYDTRPALNICCPRKGVCVLLVVLHVCEILSVVRVLVSRSFY
eukprot:g3857.t1